MAELGTHADEEHGRIGRHLAGLKIDEVYWVGERGPVVRAAMEAAGGQRAFTGFADVSALIDSGRAIPREGDVVLVKASRACGLDRFVANVMARAQNG
jgi:UDP-N-acetylmuramoyl-tripeptide--D-alanyl-D-alanine ligase